MNPSSEWLQNSLNPRDKAKRPGCRNDPIPEIIPLHLQNFISIHPTSQGRATPQPVQCRNWCKSVQIQIRIPSTLQTETNSSLQLANSWFSHIIKISQMLQFPDYFYFKKPLKWSSPQHSTHLQPKPYNSNKTPDYKRGSDPVESIWFLSIQTFLDAQGSESTLEYRIPSIPYPKQHYLNTNSPSLKISSAISTFYRCWNKSSLQHSTHLQPKPL